MRVKSKLAIVIPAGTVFNEAPGQTERIGNGHVSVVIGLSPNSMGELVYSIDDGQLDGELAEYFEKV